MSFCFLLSALCFQNILLGIGAIFFVAELSSVCAFATCIHYIVTDADAAWERKAKYTFFWSFLSVDRQISKKTREEIGHN